MTPEEPCSCRTRLSIRQAVMDWVVVIALIIDVLQYLG